MKSGAIDVKSFAQASADLGSVLDTATLDSLPVVISREDGEAAVVISLSTWNTLQENARLDSDPEVSARLEESIAQADRGEMIETERRDDRYVPVAAATAEAAE